jgi:hypothetical protein
MKYIITVPDHMRMMLELSEMELAVARVACKEPTIHAAIDHVYTMIHKINKEIKEAQNG